MHDWKSQSYDLELIDLKLEKTLCTLRHIASQSKIVDNIEMDLVQQQPQDYKATFGR